MAGTKAKRESVMPAWQWASDEQAKNKARERNKEIDMSIEQQIQSLPGMRVPELQSLFAEVTGETTRAPNKTFLIRRITEGLLAQAEAEAAPAAAEILISPTAVANAFDVEPTAAVQAPEQQDDPQQQAPQQERLTKMSLPELKQLYQDTLGRPTKGNHKGYIIWRIREARKGRVAIGPRQSKVDPNAEQVVVRLNSDVIDGMMRAMAVSGEKSRANFVRTAVKHYLDSLAS